MTVYARIIQSINDFFNTQLFRRIIRCGNHIIMPH